MRGQADNRAIRIGSGGLGVEDEAYHIYTQLFYFADVFRFGHTAYFDTKRSHILERFVVGNLLLRMMGEMKSFSVSPGWSVFIKASPMRKPRKPAARRLRIVSGCEMPLSETSMGILRTSEAPFFDPIAC